jgi:glyoxylase-like metal-dependent hydrolase (beta-lactamase superfamily II)
LSLEIERFITSGGHTVYRFPIKMFPELWGYAHLIKTPDLLILVDAGSGFGESNEHLEAGFEGVRTQYQEQFAWADLTHILVTHGHIDHFGGLNFIREKSEALIGIHELDAPMIEQYEQKISLTAKRMKDFFSEAGVEPGEQSGLLDLYLLNKVLFKSLAVDFTFGSVGMQLGPLTFMHVPGHCPGQVVIQLDEVLFTADHVLPDISPHLSPERLGFHNGLSHYLDSLISLHKLNGSIHLALPGHGGWIPDLMQRSIEIIQHHHERLTLLYQVVGETPKTLWEICQCLFAEVEGFHKILALEETGAHIEYLEQLGYLEIGNYQEMVDHNAVPIFQSTDREKDLEIAIFEPYIGRE